MYIMDDMYLYFFFLYFWSCLNNMYLNINSCKLYMIHINFSTRTEYFHKYFGHVGCFSAVCQDIFLNSFLIFSLLIKSENLSWIYNLILFWIEMSIMLLFLKLIPSLEPLQQTNIIQPNLNVLMKKKRNLNILNFDRKIKNLECYHWHQQLSLI